MGFLSSWISLFQSKSRHRHHHHHVNGAPAADGSTEPLLDENDRNEAAAPEYPAQAVTKVAVRLRYLVEQVVPYEIEESKITQANSPIVTRKVVRAAKEAGGKDHGACVLFCLLTCRRWFASQGAKELWDEGLFSARAVACEIIAKHIIEEEEREEYLMQETLLRRYSLLINGKETAPINVVEQAVDLHALRVIGTSGYQKCIRYLWWGWLVQDDMDPSNFIAYKYRATPSYWIHFDPDRMRAPQYQNWVQMSISVVYLALYTGAINTINREVDIDIVEGVLYIMTAGFVCDELTKLWKVGRYYIGFWNAFNSTLYTLLTISFVLRMVALTQPVGHDDRISLNKLSYNFLAFSAPMFWMRLLLFLDSFQFFGAMLVVLKVMMKESLIFFALLVVICIGFFQGFIAMDVIDDNETVAPFIMTAMANSVMQSPDFTGFENFAAPFGIILYYIYTFVVMVVLLNILVALYNSAYENVTDRSDDEFMALFANKTMQFVRAPDENVFIPPFNLVEIFLLVLPFEWWMSDETYERLNDFVMAVIYSPLLLIIAWLEKRSAGSVIAARRRGDADEDHLEEWERVGPATTTTTTSSAGNANTNTNTSGGNTGTSTSLNNETSPAWNPHLDESWAKSVADSCPDISADASVLLIRELKRELGDKIAEMQRAIRGLEEKVEAMGGSLVEMAQ